MPELPEVETIRQGLEPLIKGNTINGISVTWPRIIKTEQSINEWQRSLMGQSIESLSRRGKYLIFNLSNNKMLVSHLRMEGKFLFFEAENVPKVKDKHTHVRFTFNDYSELHYHDVRKFGRMELIHSGDIESYFTSKKLGPEPTSESFKIDLFSQQLATIKKAIKPALLDQHLVVGLGNIYVDEVLFQAGIHPATPAQSLNDAQIFQLHQAIIDIMNRAIIAGGSSIRTYRNAYGTEGEFQNFHQVYGKANQACPVCGTKIQKIQLSQRGTHFCPECQPRVSI
ncbi:DNA-formamidopyrimidine glycosylase [Fundicoccus culcitae]|uniref:Formamidopyrimidine-DNA glycosylase n=1 Tax=Fundicoccus culcitae TaxID=2969821 RepID=A0ABY5P6C8_9LACT|nr:DNA-formamidopyrimidine glycosylase [Fundicoccus culcitae]UUX34165.1 DNA-formamidopyrimidine glycosylase [Fundicoccus culcitae]